MFHIALFEPQIAPNTGNIMRLVANNGCKLHLIEPLGFDLDEKRVRRAGLDYRDLKNMKLYTNYSHFAQVMKGHRVIACTTKGTRNHCEVNFEVSDILLFGAETHGLSDEVMRSIEPELRIRIPMVKNSRSINLANAVAIISYEAWRQAGFDGGL